MHFHERQADLWIVLEGLATVGLVDTRPAAQAGSSAVPSAKLQMPAGSALFIPEGVAHGFLALEPLALLYLVTNEYDGTDEHGFAWNDSASGLDWPSIDPIVSDRDRSNPPLVEAISLARQRGALTSAR